ncbi:beta-glucosidase [Flexibacter flexilis DSM 6793]|uniref:beta-glucosidase n=1 Tax=Flexibacter flexilis DSM 6793 TaxID=927664 RepID=A0A1I1E654_9BACT|nr:glycoside hydrolase family 3 N-terminal domain-containing protein [Flexibacter flexilis]SFB82705.1 beta-glucosidase [Flexibacter flexilis DSM 6793]
MNLQSFNIKATAQALALGMLCLSQTAFAQNAQDAQIEKLISQMTLQEKVGQMAQITLDVIGKGKDRYSSFEPLALDTAELNKAILKYHVGSVLNTANNRARTPQVWHELINQMQAVATKKARLKIPIIYGIDAIHGTTYTAGATFFPQQIGQAATFNRNLVREGAEIAAYETRASGIRWNFSPVLDLGADPRFSRQWEGYGEDPYLGTALGLEAVKGYQGQLGQNGEIDAKHVAACLKHFLAYSAPASGKDRTPAYMSEQMLREYHLPAFKAAIEAGAATIMINSGLINNIPTHANYQILTKLLKEELNFKGLVVSDWGDIENLYRRDHIAANDKEAIMLAVNAGIDMSMIAYQYEVFCDNLVALVKEGKVKQERIDDAVRRVLRTKQQLGLFKNAVEKQKDYPKFADKTFQQAAYNTAAESITLLKNQNGVLPLAKNKKVFVTGPNANSMRTLNGGWSYSWQGEKVEDFAGQYNTILEAIQNEVGKANVQYAAGVSYKMTGSYYEEFADKLEEAVAQAAQSDVIVVCVGENSYTEKPGDLNDLYLSDLQTTLVQRLAATGKPVVVVLNEGRPRVISRFEQSVPAIVQAYLPGNFGGDAIADILFGDVNPSGKLPYNYPRYPNSVSTYYHKPSEEQKKAEGMYNYEADYNPQYEFGTGLSYTTFKYSNLQLSKNKLKVGESLSVSVDVTNTGTREGKETVLLYLSDKVASITPDVKRLKGFDKISLKPNETRKLTFTLSPAEMAFIGLDLKPTVEAGDFEVQVADQKAVFVCE